MTDLEFTKKLIKEVENRLETSIVDINSPPQGMTSKVLLVKTVSGQGYAIKFGDDAQDDVPVLNLLTENHINIPFPRLYKSFKFLGCPIVVLERIDYPLFESVPISKMATYIPSMVENLTKIHGLKSNKPGRLDNVNKVAMWKDVVLAIFNGQDFNWDKISNRKCLDKDLVLFSVSKIIEKINNTNFISDNYSLLHTDFNQRNLFVDPKTYKITGVIDWGEAMFGDPIYDFARIRMLIWHFGLPITVVEKYRKLTAFNISQIKLENLYWLSRVIQYLAWYSTELSDFNLGRIKLHQSFLREFSWDN